MEIKYQLLPTEFFDQATTIFDDAFASLFAGRIKELSDRTKLYHLIFKNTPIIYAQSNGELMGLLVLALPNSDKFLTSREIFATLGFWKGLLPAIFLSVMQSKESDPTAHINFIAVGDAFRRQGVATHLIRCAERITIDGGCTSLVLKVVEGNDGAISFYKDVGFITAGVVSVALASKIYHWSHSKIYIMHQDYLLNNPL